MKYFILLVSTLFIFNITCAQRTVMPIHLTWGAFKNNKPKNSKFDAKTWYHINYTFKVKAFDHDNVKIDFNVTLVLDTLESYFDVSKMYINLKLLNHEQGHADIGFIYAKKLQDTFQKNVFFKKDYVTSIKKIFDSIYNQMIIEHQKYDEESEHSLNDNGQKRWDDYFRRYRE